MLGYRRHPTNHREGVPRQRSQEEWIVDALRDYRWLREWQREMNYSDEEAADAVGLSLSAFRRQRSGESAVSRQTAKLAIAAVLDIEKLLKMCRMAIKVYETNTLHLSNDA